MKQTSELTSRQLRRAWKTLCKHALKTEAEVLKIFSEKGDKNGGGQIPRDDS